MKKSLIHTICLVTLSLTAVSQNIALAAPIVDETATFLMKTPEDLAWTCQPGLASNGHNYPTASSFALNSLDAIIPDLNARSAGVFDPKIRVGDHCAELKAEFTAILPATLTLRRTLSERYDWSEGSCVKGLVEEVAGAIGNYELAGDAYFVVAKVPTDLCR